MTSIVSFIILLGVLIFVHEFGHFITAKLLKIKVLKFSLGFGPKLIARQWGETEYLISALPLGGYVKLFGEQPGETIAPAELRGSFSHRPVWHRFLVVLAGPLFNLLFALIVFSFIYTVAGIPEPLPGTTIATVNTSSPAAAAGIKPGDTIIKVNGRPTLKWAAVSKIIRRSEGAPITITLRRGNKSIQLKAQAKISEIKNIFGEVVGKRYLLGISKKQDLVYKRKGIIAAWQAGLTQTWSYIYLTVMTLLKVLQRVVPASDMGGPIMIANMAGQQFQAGWNSFLSFMAVLSINLGVINLFPLPILDGGHLTFFVIEAIRKKPLTLSAQEIIQQIGIILLGTLMVFVFYNDIIRLLGHT